jgi:GABA(A) receptor-associated protein
MTSFKSKYSFEQRVEESTRVREKYPDRIPIICEKCFNCKDTSIPSISKQRYLCPEDLTCGQFMYVIRKRMKLSSDKAIFLFIGEKSKIVPASQLLSALYLENKNEDGFLYISYSGESTFGHSIEM